MKAPSPRELASSVIGRAPAWHLFVTSFHHDNDPSHLSTIPGIACPERSWSSLRRKSSKGVRRVPHQSERISRPSPRSGLTEPWVSDAGTEGGVQSQKPAPTGEALVEWRSEAVARRSDVRGFLLALGAPLDALDATTRDLEMEDPVVSATVLARMSSGAFVRLPIPLAPRCATEPGRMTMMQGSIPAATAHAS